MKILVVSFYYPPDLSAGSFRVRALVNALLEQGITQLQVDVLTTLPNRYQSFTVDAPQVESSASLRVVRVPIPVHRSDMLHQGRAFWSFARRAADLAMQTHYDLVFATSSRLMTAALGAFIARRQRIPLYLDVRDIFVDTIKDVLPRALSAPARWFFATVESMTMRSAERINLVSPGFEEYFRSRYPCRSLAGFTNGVDDEFLSVPQSDVHRPATGALPMILYAGNIGAGQALHEILPDLASALRGKARFLVIGDGGRIELLVSSLQAARLDNVELRSPIPRAQLFDAYLSADVLFLHLGAVPAFEKVLPSKIFEYAALGKPILAGVGGYAARFIREEISNAAVFPPCDVQAAIAAFNSLKLGNTARAAFVAKFARAAIMREMARDVIVTARREHS